MSKKQKRMLFRVLASAVLFAVALLLPTEGWLRLFTFLIPYAVIAWDVLWRAVRNIAHGQVFDENFLMSLATVGALATGEYPEAVFVMLFYQVGELFQSYAVDQSRKSITSLMDIRPDYANIEVDGQLRQVDPEDVAVGDTIVIKAGERIPLDGVVLEGTSNVDTAALTGESLPREAQPGDDVISGCVNLSGLLRVRVTKAFEESTVAKILDLVENSSSKKAKAENFITKFARYYTPAVVLAAVALALLPPLFTSIQWVDSIQRALNFLVVSCPCALVISVPLSFFGGIGGASKNGILVKGGNYLEVLAKTELVVFDKTGTLTRGVFNVTAIHPDHCGEAQLLELAALGGELLRPPHLPLSQGGLRQGIGCLPGIQCGGAVRPGRAGHSGRPPDLRRQRQADGGHRRELAPLSPGRHHRPRGLRWGLPGPHRHLRRGEARREGGHHRAEGLWCAQNRHAHRRRQSRG